MEKYAGADWLSKNLKTDLSPLAQEVADILGQVFRGIYHLSQRDIDASTWDDPYVVVVRLRKELATFDFCELTSLVILCHDRCVRLEISARGRGYLDLMFHQRTRSGGVASRHPTMEYAIDSIRGAVGLGLKEGENGSFGD